MHKVTIYQKTHKMEVWAVEWDLPEELSKDCTQARTVIVKTQDDVDKILSSNKRQRNILYRFTE